MYLKMDQAVISLLCCPLCKGALSRSAVAFACSACGIAFPARKVVTSAAGGESVFDFRIHRPPYCTPPGERQWMEMVDIYEEFHQREAGLDSVAGYRDEIDSVREIYRDEFHLFGNVLDVGGHQGRLRHFLGDDVSLYVSIDPFVSVFEGIGGQSGLLEAYPCLSEPCNFVVGIAEHLPFKTRSFDWVHMRSVVDHFADPYLAFTEARRCCKPGGRLLVGTALPEKKEQAFTVWRRAKEKIKREGLWGLIKTPFRRLSPRYKDPHIFHLTREHLLDLLEQTGWRVTKQHWPKPPFEFCLYVSAEPAETMAEHHP